MDKDLLLAAIPKAGALAKTGSTSFVIGEDRRQFLVALKDKNIIECTREDIKEVLRQIMLKVGIRARNMPVDEEKELIAQHVVKKYGGKTLSELALAFDLAIDGKLPLGPDESVNCFENFSILYISSIMNAYRKWARQAHKDIQAGLPDMPMPVLTDEQMDNEWRYSVETAFQAMREGKFPIIHGYYKTILEQDKLLHEGENVHDFFVRTVGNPEIKNLYVKVEPKTD